MLSTTHDTAVGGHHNRRRPPDSETPDLPPGSSGVSENVDYGSDGHGTGEWPVVEGERGAMASEPK